MPKAPPVRDRFDDIAEDKARIGVHRAYNPTLGWGRILVWSLVGFVLLTGAGILATYILTDRFAPSSTAPAAPVAESTVPGVIDTSYPVLVLNATPQEGLAGVVRDELVAAGWTAEQITDGGAGSTDFEYTTVYYANPEDQAAARGIAENVLGGARVEMTEAYAQADDPATPEDESAGSQLVVVIGLDRAS